MKNATATISLVLCLVLCLFAFVSCGKTKEGDTAKTTAAEPTEATTAAPTSGTTVPSPTEPSHVHVPDDEYFVDQEPTCLTPGSESLYCTECGNSIPGTERTIPIDPNAHTVADWNVIEAATLLNPVGRRSGHCSLCDQDVVVDYDAMIKTDVWTDASYGTYPVKDNIIDDVLKGKHFYPTDENPSGNDLFVEYSILWNETLLNLETGGYMETRIGNSGGGNDNSIIYWSMTDDCNDSACKFAGGFEYGGLRTVEVGPAGMSPLKSTGKTGTTFEDFPNIGGADQENPEWGWHRVALRLHQEVTNENDVKAGADATYYLFVECYLDGELLFRNSNAPSEVNGASSYKDVNRLFTAVSNGEGGITYADIDEDRWLYSIRVNSIETKLGTTAHFAIADLSWSVGDSFAQSVEKVASPEARTFTFSDGTEIPAPIYYRLTD